MQDPTGLFTTRLQPADSVAAGLERPVLVEALDGFVDAGNGRRLAASTCSTHWIRAGGQLRCRSAARLPSPATGDDVHHRSLGRLRRPAVGDPPGPRSRRACRSCCCRPRTRHPVGTVHRRGAGRRRRTRCAAGRRPDRDPNGVPHTRPLSIIAHGAPPELVADYPKWLPTVQVPASVGNLLEYRLGEAGTPVCGFAVAIPYYLANLDYPEAARTLLTSLATAGDLALPTEALAQAAEVVRGDVDRQIAGTEEVTTLVQRLEQQYDDLTRTARRQPARRRNAIADGRRTRRRVREVPVRPARQRAAVLNRSRALSAPRVLPGSRR